MLPWILLTVLGQQSIKEGTYTEDYPQQVTNVHCPPGMFWEGSSCEPCLAGKYSPDDSAYCTMCPAGYVAPEEGQSACIACVAGTFSTPGAFECLPCFAGTYSEGASSSCKKCPVGTTSLPNSPSLSMCMTLSNDALIAPTHEFEVDGVAKEPLENALVDDIAKAPLANALELHNEAQNAQEVAEEAEQNAEQEIAEAKEAYEHKVEAEEKLHYVNEQYEEVHHEKMEAQEEKHNAEKRYEDERLEAEQAEAEATEAREKSEQAALRAFEASHAVKMQSEGEANEAVIHAKNQEDEHFQAKLDYEDKMWIADKEISEANEAREEAEKAARFAEQQNKEAEIAEAAVQIAGNHLEIQKAEAERAQYKAEMAMQEHEVAAAHHENVLASKERNEVVWEEMLEDDCVDDPKGLVVNDVTKNCAGVGKYESATHWSCDYFDEDFNGHATYIWEICPLSCGMCNVDRDRYYEEHHHKDDEEDDLPECLSDCPFEGLDINDPKTACPWWQAEGPEHNTESCFNDCSPGVMFYVEHHVEKVCHGGPEDNPLECAMDCPIEGLDPHSAESFCPWFSKEKHNSCFHDCSDKFLNMAQAHAEHTCYDYVIDGDNEKYIDYISEPIAGAAGQYSSSSIICEGGFYRASMTGDICKVCPAGMFSERGAHECSACPIGMTSSPGAWSSDKCFVRLPLLTDESQNEESYESESEYQNYDESVHPVDEYHQTTYPTKYHDTTYRTEYHQTTYPIEYHQTTYPSEYHQTTYPSEYHQTTYPSKYHQTTYPSEYHQTTYPTEYHTTNQYYNEEFPTAANTEYHQTVHPSWETAVNEPTYYNTLYPATTSGKYANEERESTLNPEKLSYSDNNGVYTTEPSYLNSQPTYTPNAATRNSYGEAGVSGEISPEEYFTTEPSQIPEAKDFYTPSSEFVNEEYTGKPEFNEELAAPQGSESSHPEEFEGEERLSSSDHE